MKNKYIKRSKVTEAKFREILRYFSEDFDVTKTSKLTKLNRKTVSNIYQKLRKRIYELTKQESKFNGEVEIDESYFGAKRIRGKRGRGFGERVVIPMACRAVTKKDPIRFREQF